MAGEKIYIADKETLDEAKANTDAILAAVGDSEKFKPKRYGFKINKNDSNPTTKVTYLYDAVGMTPAAMNYSSGAFDYGSWADVWFVKNNYPAMVNYNGTEAYKLNPNDYTKKEDGTASDVANANFAGNAMSAIPTIWISQYEMGNYEYIILCEERYDSSYHAYAHERADGSIAKKKWFPMYEGYYDGTRIRSISGVTVTASQSGQTELNRIAANGSQWYSLTWSMTNLMWAMLTLISKCDNSQLSFGNGNSSSDTFLNTGTLNSKGQFFGYNNTSQAVKVFHCENWWGNYWIRCAGMMQLHGKVVAKMTPPYNTTGAGYEPLGVTYTGTSSGYPSKTLMSDKGRIPIAFGGSSTTYTCDYLWWNASADTYALFGGSRGPGASCGASCLDLNFAFSNAGTSIGACLSCEQPLSEA